MEANILVNLTIKSQTKASILYYQRRRLLSIILALFSDALYMSLALWWLVLKIFSGTQCFAKGRKYISAHNLLLIWPKRKVLNTFFNSISQAKKFCGHKKAFMSLVYSIANSLSDRRNLFKINLFSC